MTRPDLVFRVIVSETFPDYNPHYFYAKKTKDSDWKNKEMWFPSMEDLARNIARDIIGTKSNYLITSEPIEGKYGAEYEGIDGHSESPDGISILRKLSEQESRMLCGNLARRIAEHKRNQKVENLD